MSQAEVIDYSLSLEYASKTIKDYKEYKDLVKVVDDKYLSEIMAYEIQLQTKKSVIEHFVTDEYNLIYYLVMDKQLTNFEQLQTEMTKIDKPYFFYIISRYVLDSAEVFSPQLLLDCALSEENRWRLTALYYHFDSLRSAFCEAMSDTWSLYSQVRTRLLGIFNKKINQGEKRLQERSDELYKLVYQDYISKESYQSSTQTFLLLLAFQKVAYFQKNDVNQLALGLYAFDYFEFVKGIDSYGQEYREKVLKTLADPTRFGILKMIGDGIYSNKVMAKKFDISSAAISYQLKYLMDHHIIKTGSNSKKYRLNKELLLSVMSGIEKELFLDKF